MQPEDTVSERLRRWTRNPLGSARRGLNPLGVDWFEVGEEVDWFKVGEEMVWSRRGVEKRMGALMVREKKRRVCESGSE